LLLPEKSVIFVENYKMKLAIVGSRKITEVNIGKYIKIMPSLIISGGAMGVDTVAEEWAESKTKTHTRN